MLNPHNDKEFVSDKLSIVDAKAKDELKRIYPRNPVDELSSFTGIFGILSCRALCAPL